LRFQLLGLTGAVRLSTVSVDPHGLAPHAQRGSATRGRRFPETEHQYRSPYQRDRDRIIHCAAFRRLEYKTQVFVNHEGDHFRTRLTHSIEVSQIGRTVGRALGLNEDLIESLALCHDLGHTPFGHLGEEVLNRKLEEVGGFSHNRQTLRIVENLERRYPGFDGLNLTWEVREGIAKHSGAIDILKEPEAAEYDPERQPPLEAQLIDLVDETAYNHHDVDDGLAAGILDVERLASAVPLFGDAWEQARSRFPGTSQRRCRSEALRRMIDTMVSDLIAETGRRIEAAGVESVDDVRKHPHLLAGMSRSVAEQNKALKGYLHEHLYRHYRIERMMDKARRLLRALFERYSDNPRLMPTEYQNLDGSDLLPIRIADYIAGMTDRYANEEYKRLYDPTVRV